MRKTIFFAFILAVFFNLTACASLIFEGMTRAVSGPSSLTITEKQLNDNIDGIVRVVETKASSLGYQNTETKKYSNGYKLWFTNNRVDHRLDLEVLVAVIDGKGNIDASQKVIGNQHNITIGENGYPGEIVGAVKSYLENK